jgi:hypothetical protein
MNTSSKQLQLNVLLTALYSFAVAAAAQYGNSKWAWAIAAALPIGRAILGFFGTLPMDKPAAS